MAYKKSFNIIITALLLCLASASYAAKEEANNAKFPPISGEIYGQVIPGIRSLSVNGKPVLVGADQSFRTSVNLKAGEKYLILRINYEGLKIIKKYLILRRPQVKTFKVFVPKEEIKKPLAVAKPVKAVAPKITKKSKKPIRKPAAKAKKKSTPKAVKPPVQVTTEYLYVWEFDRGKLLLVKQFKGQYSAEVMIPAKKESYDFQALSREELQQIINENLAAKEIKKK